MKKLQFHIFARLIPHVAALSCMICAASCESADPDFAQAGVNRAEVPGTREPSEETRNVLVLYLAGHNNLSSYMKGDLQDLMKGYIPPKRHGRSDNILLVYSQFPGGSGYSSPLQSHLVRLSSTEDGAVQADTLRSYGADVISADSQTVRTVLSDVKAMFPAKGYGLLFSSHSTGWLPAGYTSRDETVERSPQRSIGQARANGTSYEIDLRNFAKSIPMYMDYIIFDVCLAGGVEVAYELKDVCRYLAISPAEILADGFEYKTLAGHLIGSRTPDVRSVVEDFFAQYSGENAQQPYCTASLVDCSHLDSLANVCSRIFESHREELGKVRPSSVQGYFQYGWHWFYDLEDIIVKAGASEHELKELSGALSWCVMVNEATPYFISFPVNTHCGLSMYLPCNGNADLDRYYRGLKWNMATKLCL